MSRHAIDLGKDDNCIIGFDPMMETLFFQSGEANAKTSEPYLWLGADSREFLDPSALEKAIRGRSGEAQFRIEPKLTETLRGEVSRHFNDLAESGRMSRQEVSGLLRGARPRIEVAR